MFESFWFILGAVSGPAIGAAVFFVLCELSEWRQRRSMAKAQAKLCKNCHQRYDLHTSQHYGKIDPFNSYLACPKMDWWDDAKDEHMWRASA